MNPHLAVLANFPPDAPFRHPTPHHLARQRFRDAFAAMLWFHKQRRQTSVKAEKDPRDGRLLPVSRLINIRRHSGDPGQGLVRARQMRPAPDQRVVVREDSCPPLTILEPVPGR